MQVRLVSQLFLTLTLLTRGKIYFESCLLTLGRNRTTPSNHHYSEEEDYQIQWFIEQIKPVIYQL